MRKVCYQGFGLIELLIILTIIMITLSLSAPNFIGFIERNRAFNTRQSITSGLSLTRSYAIIHQRPTEMCGSSDGLKCDHQWSKGWLVRVIRTQKSVRSEQFAAIDGRLNWGRPDSTIRYMPNGTSPASNSSFLYCTQESGSWRIVLNRQGRARVELNIEDQDCS